MMCRRRFGCQVMWSQNGTDLRGGCGRSTRALFESKSINALENFQISKACRAISTKLYLGTANIWGATLEPKKQPFYTSREGRSGIGKTTVFFIAFAPPIKAIFTRDLRFSDRYNAWRRWKTSPSHTICVTRERLRMCTVRGL